MDLSPKRRRNDVACLPCRNRHEACSEGRPCQRCVDKGRAGQCVDAKPEPSPGRVRTRPSIDLLSDLRPPVRSKPPKMIRANSLKTPSTVPYSVSDWPDSRVNDPPYVAPTGRSYSLPGIPWNSTSYEDPNFSLYRPASTNPSYNPSLSPTYSTSSYSSSSNPSSSSYHFPAPNLLMDNNPPPLPVVNHYASMYLQPSSESTSYGLTPNWQSPYESNPNGFYDSASSDAYSNDWPF